MRRFSFKLEAVRVLREQTQNQAEQDLARELALREQRVSDLETAARRVEHARASSAAPPGSSVAAHDLLRRQSFVERVEREQGAAAEGLATAEQDVAHGRQRLELASRDREVLERLKRTRLAEHDREVARQEEATLGEVALASYQRRAGERAA